MALRVEAKHLYQQADELWSQGKLRTAFRLFLAAAKAGMVAAFNIVASFYDQGNGVRANEKAALYWYRRAYQGERNQVAANNIGCIWRDEGKLDRAVWWLKRAVELGDPNYGCCESPRACCVPVGCDCGWAGALALGLRRVLNVWKFSPAFGTDSRCAPSRAPSRRRSCQARRAA